MKKKILLIFIFVLLLTGCNKTNTKEPKKEEKVTTYYENGKEVYYNPETNKKCDSSDVVSTGNSGCLKWYAFGDEEEGKETLTMILDHNTSLKAAYTGGEDLYGVAANSANNQLKIDTKKWNKNLKARNISIADLEKILNIKFEQKALYLETGNQTVPTEYTKYNWLYDNTNSCTNYGCKSINNDTLGYWTTDTVMNGENATLYAWVITNNGSINYNQKNIASRYGIRPVIEVEKKVIK